MYTVRIGCGTTSALGSSAEVRQALREAVSPKAIGIAPLRLAVGKPEEKLVRVVLPDPEQAQILVAAVENLGGELSAERIEDGDPMVSVFGLPQGTPAEEIKADLERLEEGARARPLYKFGKTGNGRTEHWAVLVNSSLRAKLVTEKRAQIGWTICRVADRLRLRQCRKCLGFKHSEKNCRNKPRCPRCAGEHIKSECQAPPSRPPKCYNCTSRGRADAKHRGDSEACPTYLARAKELVRETDYK